MTNGLFYLRARYYDPSTAQFISRDPMITTTRQPYAYVGDNPLNNTDPSGQSFLSPITNLLSGAASLAGQAFQAATHPAQTLNVLNVVATLASAGFDACSISVVGFVPCEIGSLAAGGVGLTIDFATRNFSNMPLDIIGMVPGVGDLAAALKLGRLGAKTGKLLKGIGAASTVRDFANVGGLIGSGTAPSASCPTPNPTPGPAP